jgi:2',3'-cyclic-nucleotide 2'-phosphodiesterase (5'-nucleotidase family)
MNTATEMELTGKDIRSALEQSLTLKTGMLQLSGMRVTYDLSKPEYQRVVSAQVGSDPLDDGRTYKIVASSFVALGGDHYETFLNGKNVHDTGELLCDVFTEYARKMGRLSAPPQNRLMAQTK